MTLSMEEWFMRLLLVTEIRDTAELTYMEDFYNSH